MDMLALCVSKKSDVNNVFATMVPFLPFKLEQSDFGTNFQAVNYSHKNT